MTTWISPPEPKPKPLTPRGLLRVALRGIPIAVIITIGLLSTLLLRIVERPLFHPSRPITPGITVAVCRLVLWFFRIKPEIHGHPDKTAIASVANHSTWLDIFVLNAQQRLYFVSKSEVERWPVIGWLARATGTIFIKRARTEAAKQVAQMQDRMRAGHHLLFFPEGTSTDGQQVLTFKTTLFATFTVEKLREGRIQPISLRYIPPPGEDERFFGWWGEMSFGPNLLQVLAAPSGAKVRVHFEPAIAIKDTKDRKELAMVLETSVRKGFEA